MVPITSTQLHLLAPNIRAVYATAFETADTDLANCGVNATPLRLRHFMAQILHESGGFSLLWENMNYSAPGLVATWPSRFKPRGPLDPNAFAHQREKIGNEVYGNRMGNNSTNGYLYRGRGLIQTTGHDGYQAATRAVRAAFPGAAVPDFVANPDDLLLPAWCLKVAAAEYQADGCNALADADTEPPTKTNIALSRITRKINGGQIGLPSRAEWLRRVSNVW